MRKFEKKIKLLFGGLLALTAFLIILLMYLPSFLESTNSSALSVEIAAAEESFNKTIEPTKPIESVALAEQPKKKIAKTKPIPLPPVPQATSIVKPIPPTPSVKPKDLFFIIDDVGYDIEQLMPFLTFPGNLTIAILPGLEHSEEAAKLAQKHGKKAILHQPMEAIGKNDPGPGAIMLGMENEQIMQVLDNNIDSLIGLIGINNHMGSAITSDSRIMEVVLTRLQQRNLIFIDSMTAPSSVSGEVAAKISYPIAKRDIFLDNEDNMDAIMRYLKSGLKEAETNGYAVMIGHVWSDHLANALNEVYPDLQKNGFTLKDASNLIME